MSELQAKRATRVLLRATEGARSEHSERCSARPRSNDRYDEDEERAKRATRALLRRAEGARHERSELWCAHPRATKLRVVALSGPGAEPQGLYAAPSGRAPRVKRAAHARAHEVEGTTCKESRQPRKVRRPTSEASRTGPPPFARY